MDSEYRIGVMISTNITAVTIVDLLKNKRLCRIIWTCSYYLVMIYFFGMFVPPLQSTILYQIKC